MTALELPYQPIHASLYSRQELFTGFDSSDPGSFARTPDFAIYRHAVVEGGYLPRNPYVGMMQALHDTSITQATQAFIAGRRVAGIMGGHKLLRDSAAYRQVALLARRLTRDGILVCTGGGPGGMEAAHLGAALANRPDADLEAALQRLSAQPAVPALKHIVRPDGTPDPELVRLAHAWFQPALEIAESIPDPGHSLAVPTWHYGHEPTTPLATHIAKYFQNSIREDGLLAIAKAGVVFAQGKAGTIQEIFQDATQNFYRTLGDFSPMVLLGTKYWTDDYPVVPVLQKLFGPDFSRYVRVTDDIDQAADFLEGFGA